MKLSFSFAQQIYLSTEQKLLWKSYLHRKEETTYKLFIVLNFQHQNFSVYCSIEKLFFTIFSFVAFFAFVMKILTNFSSAGESNGKGKSLICSENSLLSLFLRHRNLIALWEWEDEFEKFFSWWYEVAQSEKNFRWNLKKLLI